LCSVGLSDFGFKQEIMHQGLGHRLAMCSSLSRPALNSIMTVNLTPRIWHEEPQYKISSGALQTSPYRIAIWRKSGTTIYSATGIIADPRKVRTDIAAAMSSRRAFQLIVILECYRVSAR
jgi:hypothetical protein